NGITRGSQTYYDGTPGNLSESLPYMIRFRRTVPGQPTANEDVGTRAWTADPAVLVYGQDGPGERFIFTRTADDDSDLSTIPDPPTFVSGQNDPSTTAFQNDEYLPAGAGKVLWRSQRTLTYTNGVFTRATAWGAVEEVN
ncbi:MAG: hypothetical protein OXC91_04315, partial [Rhodobacteraceae bacterium]|nr:hypothetical protein [Paracoccaceae bacterium]